MSTVPILEPLEAYELWAPGYPPYAHNPVMQAEERAMLALVPDDLAGFSVLDAGCGSGRYLRHVRDRGAARMVGVDLSPAMLHRGSKALRAEAGQPCAFVQGDLAALPLATESVDMAICSLAVGHLTSLMPALAELRRVTRRGGTVLCSDVHPIGPALGWQRDFKAAGRRYAVRHTQYLYSHWHSACAELDLAIEEVHEPFLDPADIPPGARFDRVALEVPVALVLRLRRPA